MKDYLLTLTAAIDYSPLPDTSATPGRLDTILGVVFGIAGAVALLFLVIGGVRYIISRGDPQSTAQARDTIIYSIVGLVVVIISFSIVTFVINNV